MTGFFNGFLNAFFLVYAALFPIVNPLGNAPIFLDLTRHCSLKTRHALAWRVAAGGFLLLLASFVCGSRLLVFFGITLPVVRVAGGLVVATVGWRILNQSPGPDDGTPAETVDRAQNKAQSEAQDNARAARQAFYPLTMPLTVGPGSIATAIALGSGKPAAVEMDFRHFLLEIAASVAALAAVAVTIWLSYRFADRIERVLGPSGTNVLVRLFAFILLCIGAQITWNGLLELLVAARLV